MSDSRDTSCSPAVEDVETTASFVDCSDTDSLPVLEGPPGLSLPPGGLADRLEAMKVEVTWSPEGLERPVQPCDSAESLERPAGPPPGISQQQDGGGWSGTLHWFQPGELAFVHYTTSTPAEPRGVWVTVRRWDKATGRWQVILPSGTERLVLSTVMSPIVSQDMYSDDYRGDYVSWYGAGGAGGEWPQHPQRHHHQQVVIPRNKYDLPADQWTTVMMRNVPNGYSSRALLELIDQEGFEGTYRFVYLPIDYRRQANYGYAFIDFGTNEGALAFKQHFDGFKNWAVGSQKVCRVSWSDTWQGVEAHIDRYRNSPIMHSDVPDEMRPLLFKEGKRVPFPPPTKGLWLSNAFKAPFSP